MTEARFPPDRPCSCDGVERMLRQLMRETLMLDDGAVENLDPDLKDFIVALGANSIDALELIIAVEEQLDFEFADEELNLELFDTFRHFVTRVCQKIGIPEQ